MKNAKETKKQCLQGYEKYKKHCERLKRKEMTMRDTTKKTKKQTKLNL